MRLELIKKLPPEGAIVFVVKEGGAVRTHPFFKALTEEEQHYIESTFPKLFIQASSAKLIVFPAGRRALIVGAPAKNKFNSRKAILAARRVIVSARTEKIRHLAVVLEDFRARTSVQETAAMLGTQFEIANFEFVKYKTTPKEGWNFVEQISVISNSASQSLRKALEAGKIIGEEMNGARTLSNTPG